MDVLIGDLKPYKTVSAKAVEDTSILRLPGRAFVDVLQKYPDYLVRITQIITVRLQRVAFTALHNYLVLTSETNFSLMFVQSVCNQRIATKWTLQPAVMTNKAMVVNLASVFHLKNKLPQVEKEIAEMLKLKDASILKNKINIIHVSEGTILCKEGDYNCSLLFVLDGLLYATQKELNGEESNRVRQCSV